MLTKIIQDFKANLLELEALKPGHTDNRYSWATIKKTFEQHLPVLSADAVEKFHRQLDNTDDLQADMPAEVKRKKYGPRRRLTGVPSALAMTSHVVDYLKTCENMTASKAAIYNAIKNKYPAEVQAIPHRSRGKDNPNLSALEYILEWAGTLLTRNGKAIGRNQDPSLPRKHLKLASTAKFTNAEMAYLKKNNNSLIGFKNK
jgi:hypothetical protein